MYEYAAVVVAVWNIRLDVSGRTAAHPRDPRLVWTAPGITGTVPGRSLRHGTIIAPMNIRALDLVHKWVPLSTRAEALSTEMAGFRLFGVGVARLRAQASALGLLLRVEHLPQ